MSVAVFMIKAKNVQGRITYKVLDRGSIKSLHEHFGRCFASSNKGDFLIL